MVESAVLRSFVKWWYAGLNESPILIDAFLSAERWRSVQVRISAGCGGIGGMLPVVIDLFWVVMRSCIRVMAPKG